MLFRSERRILRHVLQSNAREISLRDSPPASAALRPGDVVVTGNGRSFNSGVPIGTIIEVDRNDAALYQSAVVRPAVELGALDRVVVLTK